MDRQRFKVILIRWVVLLLFVQLYLVVPAGYAQTPEPAVSPPAAEPTPLPATQTQATAIPLEQSPPGVAEVTFAQLDQPTFELRSPIDQQSFGFDVPYRWLLSGDSSFIELHYDMQHEASDPAVQPGTVNATINVYFDETLVSTFIPVEGTDQTLRIPIPPEALIDPRQDQHQLRFVHLSGNCNDYIERSAMVIHDDSFIHFAYELAPLEVNLAYFPLPLVQNFFMPEPILLVIPDEYSNADLAAAASVAATLGHHGFYKIDLDIVPASEVTPERLANSSAVIIGQPQTNSFLLNLYQRNLLPTTLTADGSLIANSATQPISEDEGVLQEVVSDVSPDHVYLIVTGTSDEAVTRAANALSVLTPRYGLDGNLVVISEFHKFDANAATSTDTFSLADLGFKDITMYGSEARSATVRFFVPANWRLSGKPTLTLSYLPSGQLSDSGSNITINLNNEPVGSVAIDPTIPGEQQVEIELPTADIKPGVRNRLGFEANLNVELPRCALPELNATWIRIKGTSQLHLPHTEAEEENIVASLNDPLVSFASRQDLSNVWFALPEDPRPEELVAMLRVAAWLGNFSDGPGFAPQVSRGAVSDMAQLEDYNVIAIGRPTANPVIAEINDQLPQSFMPGEDSLHQQVGNVVYRLPDQFSLGLLQALPAPWNPDQRTVLVVTGTTPEGVQWAIDTLSSEETYYQLKGDLAFIRADRIESFNSSKFLREPLALAVEKLAEEGEAVASANSAVITPTATLSASLAVAMPTPPAPDFPPKDYTPPSTTSLKMNWLIFGLIGAGLVVAVVGGTLNQRRARSR